MVWRLPAQSSCPILRQEEGQSNHDEEVPLTKTSPGAHTPGEERSRHRRGEIPATQARKVCLWPRVRATARTRGTPQPSLRWLFSIVGVARLTWSARGVVPHPRYDRYQFVSVGDQRASPGTEDVSQVLHRVNECTYHSLP